MSELDKNQDLQKEETLDNDSTTPTEKVKDQQDEKSQPDLDKVENRLKEIERLNRRYKEQLSGKDKLIEDLRARKLAEAFQPQQRAPERNDGYEDEPRPTNNRPNIDPMSIQAVSKVNKMEAREKYRNDSKVPWTSDVETEVEAVLSRWDPSGLIRIKADAYEEAYRVVRGQKLEDQIADAEAKAKAEAKSEIDKLKKKDRDKAVEQVESSTAPTNDPKRPSIEDVISGKVKMTSKEMYDTFPELQAKLPKNLF